MITLLDQLGHKIHLTAHPQRVISLVPSMTELWVDMFGMSSLIGRTKFCVHPKPQINDIQKIGGTKNPRIEDIIGLKPELILANKEENVKEHIDLLSLHCPIYTSDVKTIKDNTKLINDFQKMGTHSSINSEMVTNAYNDIKTHQTLGSAIYIIWKKPFMLAGGDTFINAMLENLGFENVFKHVSRYPEISVEDIISINPDYIFLSSEPYPFKPIDIEDLKKIGVKSKILMVDGEAFSWYGSRILYSKKYFQQFTAQLIDSKN